jgi:hypothetical protein
MSFEGEVSAVLRDLHKKEISELVVRHFLSGKRVFIDILEAVIRTRISPMRILFPN